MKFSNYATSTLQVQSDLQAELAAGFSAESAAPAMSSATK
jgi:hypothetical protein